MPERTEDQISIKSAWGLCEQGQRGNNEDALFPMPTAQGGLPESRVFVVCDGVGGMEKGEVASQLVTDLMGSRLGNRETVDPSDIEGLVAEAEDRITEFIEEHALEQEMATTLAMVHIGTDALTVAHLGDSRVYQFRDNRILKVTRDHSFVNELLDQNVLTEEEVRVHPKRNVVTRSISTNAHRHEAEITQHTDIAEGDLLLLCSDGITESISDIGLTEIVGNRAWNADHKLQEIGSRCQRQSRDNYTAILIELHGPARPAPTSAPAASRSGGHQRHRLRMAATGALLGLIVILTLWTAFSGSPEAQPTPSDPIPAPDGAAISASEESRKALEELSTIEFPAQTPDSTSPADPDPLPPGP